MNSVTVLSLFRIFCLLLGTFWFNGASVQILKDLLISDLPGFPLPPNISSTISSPGCHVICTKVIFHYMQNPPCSPITFMAVWMFSDLPRLHLGTKTFAFEALETFQITYKEMHRSPLGNCHYFSSAALEKYFLPLQTYHPPYHSEIKFVYHSNYIET